MTELLGEAWIKKFDAAAASVASDGPHLLHIDSVESNTGTLHQCSAGTRYSPSASLGEKSPVSGTGVPPCQALGYAKKPVTPFFLYIFE